MKHPIDLATWNRREHFAFFSQFEEPFHGLVASVDCTPALAAAKRLGVSFFLYYLHRALQAANAVENLRYRIEDGQVVCYDQVHASATLGRPAHIGRGRELDEPACAFVKTVDRDDLKKLDV